MENDTEENIGARRLYTVIEKLLEDISFHAPEYDCGDFTVTKEYVQSIFKDEEEGFTKDMSKFIL